MKNKILDLLLSTDDYISGEYISNLLGVSRNSIWKHINSLKKKISMNHQIRIQRIQSGRIELIALHTTK